jgi:hypothetical protein
LGGKSEDFARNYLHPQGEFAEFKVAIANVTNVKPAA